MSSAHPAHAARQGGFTLLEVLAGLVLASLVLVSLNMAMSAIGKGVDRTRRGLSQQTEIATAVDIFGSDLDRAAKIRRVPLPDFKGYLFQGSSAEMVFPVRERRGVASAGLYLVRFSIQPGKGGSQLLRERAPLPFGEPAPDLPKWRDPVVLLSGPYQIAFAYRAQKSGIREWSDGWTGAENIPEQVRLTITDTATGRLRVPGFVQSLGVDTEVDCASAREERCGTAAAEAGQ